MHQHPPRRTGPEPHWTVWRQDDNGNRFPIRRGLPEAEARSLASHYEGLGHKQLYWAERDEAAA